jgi:predicted O-methyltransferase YrrM
MKEKIKHTFEQYPGMFNYELLYKAMVRKWPAGSKFLEVGSYCGRSGCYMATEIFNSDKDIEWHMVDNWAWEGTFRIRYLDENKNEQEKHLKKDEAKAFAVSAVAPFSDFTTIHHQPSAEVSKKFKDKTFDFIWLDGDHSGEGCAVDIEAWLPKVKPGGILAGHDYLFGNPNIKKDYVADAVNDAFGEVSYLDYEYIKNLIDLPKWLTEERYIKKCTEKLPHWRKLYGQLPHSIVIGGAWLIDTSLHK